DGDVQILLPDPGDGGRIAALVLFNRDVTGLRFCPVQGASRFCIEGFSLGRVSRGTALGKMLGPTARTPGGFVPRAARFVVDALRMGLSQATGALYRDYRRRLLPEGLGDYAGWVARYDTL